MDSLGHKLRVLIPTTRGPVEILLLTEEDRSVGRSVACIGGTTRLADIDSDYQAFVARPSGIIERLFGEPCYRMDLSHPIDAGDSWQLGVLVAHALHSERRLAQEGEEADGIVWATGSVRAVDLTVGAVAHLNEKLQQSFSRLESEAEVGRKVLAIIPARNAADFPADYRAKLSACAEVFEISAVGPIWAKLGLTIRRQAARRSLSPHILWGATVALFLCVALGGAYLRSTALRPSNRQAEAYPKAAMAALPTIKDCEVCPEMLELPTGEFLMGSSETENGRRQTEGPPRRVAVAKRIAIGRFEVTVDQFSAHLAEIGEADKVGCRVIAKVDGDDVTWGPPDASFRHPGFATTGSHPAVCVSWHDARGYAAWLSRRTGKPYRLPTEAEWEYAARAGTTTSYSFGIDDTRLCDYARFADLSSSFGWRGSCRRTVSGYGPSPVGELKPNPWGIFDVHGNVWEWVEDCWTPEWQNIPLDSSAFTRPGSCEVGVIRGGSFAAGASRVRSASRWPTRSNARVYHVGFRVALDLETH
jgi:formylglycine-generating enzyme required for sulfatase activity